jgi:hypothetical protein
MSARAKREQANSEATRRLTARSLTMEWASPTTFSGCGRRIG